MNRNLYLVCIGLVLLNGCARSKILQVDPPAQRQASSSGDTTRQKIDACTVTIPIKDQPASDPNASSFGFGDYYINADRTMWVRSMPWQAGKADKVIWIRPSGTDLEVRGHRLDGKAPPLLVGIPCCYPTGFQVTGIRFPKGGCWEVIARAGNSELRFVTIVAPAKTVSKSDQ